MIPAGQLFIKLIGTDIGLNARFLFHKAFISHFTELGSEYFGYAWIERVNGAI